MAKFFDISQWQEKPHFQTGGTRSKSILENPENNALYFFKTSIKKEKIDYKHEFWSEIIASEVGLALGFNMLAYDIAWKNDEIGCLSKSMIDLDVERLNEGVNYLRGYNPSYNPEDKSRYNEYTFAFICKALKAFRIEFGIEELVKVIIFDSIIGNSDRHQENWGFIILNIEVDEEKKNKYVDSRLFKTVLGFILKKGETKEFVSFIKGRFSPIYDSGSCLGREIADEKVDQMLHDMRMLEAYINRGPSEIRWTGAKINHFELISEIKNEYSKVVIDEIERLMNVYNEQTIHDIVHNIDQNLPENLKVYCLPNNRKELIVKMINLRFEKLKEILK